MGIYFLIIGVTLILYVLFWRLYLFVAPKIMSDSLPEYVRKPKLWQFFLLVFVLSYVREKLDI